MAFAFQTISEAIQPCIGQVVITFIYLASLYVWFAFAFLDIIHYPADWGRHREILFRAILLAGAVVATALLAVGGDDAQLAERSLLGTTAFMSLSLLPDVIRGGRVLQKKELLSWGWIIASLTGLLWQSLLWP